jgi:hypothetical protein
MPTAVESPRCTNSGPDDSHYSDSQRPSKKRSIQHPKVLKQKSIVGREDTRMSSKVECLWADSDNIDYEEARKSILKQWTESGLPDKKFLEKAVDLFAEYQKLPKKCIKEYLEFSDSVENAGVDSTRYFKWQAEQLDLLASMRERPFKNITLGRFSESLLKADWKHANDESAIINRYLLYTEMSDKPEI